MRKIIATCIDKSPSGISGGSSNITKTLFKNGT